MFKHPNHVTDVSVPILGVMRSWTVLSQYHSILSTETFLSALNLCIVVRHFLHSCRYFSHSSCCCSSHSYIVLFILTVLVLGLLTVFAGNLWSLSLFLSAVFSDVFLEASHHFLSTILEASRCFSRQSWKHFIFVIVLEAFCCFCWPEVSRCFSRPFLLSRCFSRPFCAFL